MFNQSTHDTLKQEHEALPDVENASPTGVAPQCVAQAGAVTEKPYSIFTTSEKWFIVALTALGSLFSPFTSNIYFPAIPTLAAAFHRSIEDINLTVTVYMVVQALGLHYTFSPFHWAAWLTKSSSAPMFWGTFADRWGRRPMFLACILVLSLSCVGLALTPTDAYWLLMVLRCAQAAGSASTVALGRTLHWTSPWRGSDTGSWLEVIIHEWSIFWFLVIASGVTFIVMLLFMPETFRAIVGDGSIPPLRFSRPLLPVIGRGRQQSTQRDTTTLSPPRRFTNPFGLFLSPGITLLLLFNGIVNATFYGVITSISTLFQTTYPHLNETEIGLCFMAIGGGMLIGGVITGRILDGEYRRLKQRAVAAAEKELDPEKRSREEDVATSEKFPIEHARLRLTPIYLIVLVATCVGQGWAIDKGANLAAPLILQFFFGWATIAMMNIAQTLTVDLVPGQSASVSACVGILGFKDGVTR
ncbi:predicted protein [Postia placenta Mad-698-R]|uniref:Major facilitator superfamily (MFS) profile domain-containing protein n=1 Tax=Postia placenta MAD-698-R-SB12 TaxID=670580 RepID=A0A1X6NF09_9APHY|nr:hypothetical protein POSPLADRAFT_1042490 [Postia placenta MAD-698-R-SB12]EED79113.1 predicted protein [Postia placenta Mad-698-R]OSX67229.1 hypothetical protein POSPLADRAFT_1042490 [Postia placenta MAD-698-R-SB12]